MIKDFSLTSEGKQICWMKVDDKGMGNCSFKEIDNVILFCSYIIGVISDVYKNQTESQRQIH